MRTHARKRMRLSVIACAMVAEAGLIQAGDPLTMIEMAAARDCDCSCETFATFTSRMNELSEAAQSGEAMAMTPELQQAAACAAQCAMEWSRCGAGDTAGSREGTVPEPVDSTGRVASSPGQSQAASGAEADAQGDASHPLGEPRDDLERFYGVYGDGSGRDFFVTAAKRPPGSETEIPPGYLMIGAMWGDVAPWYMKSVAETRFEQQWVNPAGEPVIAAFEVDGSGGVEAIVFETVFEDRGRLQRAGDLPEGW